MPDVSRKAYRAVVGCICCRIDSACILRATRTVITATTGITNDANRAAQKMEIASVCDAWRTVRFSVASDIG